MESSQWLILAYSIYIVCSLICTVSLKKKKKDLALEFEEIPQIRLNIFQVLIKINTF